MKTRFVFEMFACVALLCGTGYTDRTASAEPRDQSGHAPASPQRSRRGGPVRSNLPKPLPRRQTHFPSEGAMNPRRGPDGSSPAAKGALIQNPTAGRRPPVRLPGPIGAAEPPLSKVRHRSPNPPVVAGSAELSKRSTGAIDGIQVHRKP